MQSIADIKADVLSLSDSDYCHQAILLNCSCHTFEEVISQIIKAIGCTKFKAGHLANIAHFAGQVRVFEGSLVDCENVAKILGETDLGVIVI